MNYLSSYIKKGNVVLVEQIEFEIILKIEKIFNYANM